MPIKIVPKHTLTSEGILCSMNCGLKAQHDYSLEVISK